MGLGIAQDEHIGPTPFAFEPYHPASLVDPKDLEALEAMDRAEGPLIGLGVDPDSGLMLVERSLSLQKSLEWSSLTPLMRRLRVNTLAKLVLTAVLLSTGSGYTNRTLPYSKEH